MRRSLTTQADFVLVGDRMSAALAANTADVPHLTPYQEKLEALLDQMRELTAQQDALTASKQSVTREIQIVHATGTKLVLLLRRAVQEHYGTRHEKLIEYGVQPYRGRPRRLEGTLTPPPTTTPPPVIE
jgi:hypothetical protein